MFYVSVCILFYFIDMVYLIYSLLLNFKIVLVFFYIELRWNIFVFIIFSIWLFFYGVFLLVDFLEKEYINNYSFKGIVVLFFGKYILIYFFISIVWVFLNLVINYKLILKNEYLFKLYLWYKCGYFYLRNVVLMLNYFFVVLIK